MKVHCEHCDGYYDLPKARTRRLLEKVLFFAVCPLCGGLRDARSAFYPYPRCGECNAPIEKGKQCRADYMIIWRRIQKSRFKQDFA